MRAMRFIPRDLGLASRRFAWATRTSALSANLEQRLGEEAAGPVGWLIPVPEVEGAEGDDDDAAVTDPLAQLARDVANLKGKTRLVPTTASRVSAEIASMPRGSIGKLKESAVLRQRQPFRFAPMHRWRS